MAKKLLAFILASAFTISMSASALASEDPNIISEERVTDVSSSENMVQQESEIPATNSEDEKQAEVDSEESLTENSTPVEDETNKVSSESTPALQKEEKSEETPDSKDAMPEANADLLPETKISISGTPSAANLSDEAVKLTSDDIVLTGETLSLSKQRAGSAITNKYGSISGTLTSTNTWDYYTFPSNATVYSISHIITNNPSYTMTLGVVDYTTGTINLTNYVTAANKEFIATIDANEYIGAFAWVIQSANGTYGNDYTLQYNMSMPPSDLPLYITGDLQKLYSIGGKKLRINNQIQNIDYKYDSEYEWFPPGGGDMQWRYLHISMQNANVSKAHVGGVKFKSGLNQHDYPNAILLRLETGGTFYHSFWQSPPHVHFVEKDMYKIPTPRAIDADDANRGGHYLVYDIPSGQVVEMISGLVQPWSAYGDRTDFVVY